MHEIKSMKKKKYFYDKTYLSRLSKLIVNSEREDEKQGKSGGLLEKKKNIKNMQGLVL